MSSELDLLQHLNPVSPSDAASWTDTEAAKLAHSRVLERIAEQRRQPTPDPYDLGTRSPGFGIVAAILLAVAIAIPVLVVGRPPVPDPPPPNPDVFLGLGYVWDGGHDATPVEAGQAFAARVLDWDNALVTPRPDASVGDQTWVHIRTDGRPELWILTESKPWGSVAVVQVGTQPPVVEQNDAGTTVVRWPHVTDSVSADINAWSSATPHNTVQLTQQDLDRGSLDADQVAWGAIRTILIRYRGSNGDVIAAIGGVFDPPQSAQTPQPETPQE